MKITLLSRDMKMVKEWNKYFSEAKVDIVCEDFEEFMSKNKVDCVVSPANSFGLMDGGYDAAITEWFGDKLQYDVQEYIKRNFLGEQPVGSSFIIETPDENIKLIHTPTMRIPEKILDEAIIYHCMRSCLITAIQNKTEHILIPAFGALTGGVKCDKVAEMMWLAYKQIYSENKEITWEYAIDTHYRKIDC